MMDICRENPPGDSGPFLCLMISAEEGAVFGKHSWRKDDTVRPTVPKNEGLKILVQLLHFFVCNLYVSKLLNLHQLVAGSVNFRAPGIKHAGKDLLNQNE